LAAELLTVWLMAAQPETLWLIMLWLMAAQPETLWLTMVRRIEA
jgi:hypothetical protein